MFKSLRDKLKGWVKKVEDEAPEEESSSEEIIENKVVKTSKKTPKKEEKKKNKPKEKEEKKSSKKKEKKTKTSKEKKEEITGKEILEEIEEEEIEELANIQEESTPVEETDSEDSSEEVVEEVSKKKFSFRKKISEEKLYDLFEELRMMLLQNNVAYAVVDEIEKTLREKLVGENLSSLNIEKELEEAIKNVLINPPNVIQTIKESLKKSSPYIIALVGINGSGKTTSIAKLTKFLQKEKLSVCVAAADTFRAAAVEQLETHANNLNVPIIKKAYDSDPASVAFEAVSYAKKNKIDVVLIDTAGRLNSRESLMKELEKIIKVANPHMKIFVGESITGNDATEQAKAFNDLIDLDGIILSKADIDEKGGTAISVSKVTGKPILFIGTGQEYDDLEIFDKEKILKTLNLD